MDRNDPEINFYTTMDEHLRRMSIEFREHDAKVSKLLMAIDEFVHKRLECYDDLIITFRIYYPDGPAIENVLLKFDNDEQIQYIWEYDWDEGFDFDLIGITPVTEVEPLYKYYKETGGFINDSKEV